MSRGVIYDVHIRLTQHIIYGCYEESIFQIVSTKITIKLKEIMQKGRGRLEEAY